MSVILALQKRLGMLRSKLARRNDAATSRFEDFKTLPPNDSTGENLERILERIRKSAADAPRTEEKIPAESDS